MRTVHTSVAIVLLLSAGASSGYCPNYPDVKTEFAESELVFVGKVISKKKIHESSEGYFDGINYRLSVTEPLRGNPSQTVTVFSENSSGRFPMTVGVSYLVFTSITPGTFAETPVYTISYCGNSGTLKEKGKALSLARKLSRSMPNKALQPTSPLRGAAPELKR